MCKNPNILDWIALIILFVGGLNWGLVGLFHYDLIMSIFGDYNPIARVAYITIGLSALYILVRALGHSKKSASMN